MGSGASHTSTVPTYPTAEMQRYADRVAACEAGMQCSEPSPLARKLRQTYQGLRSSLSLKMGGVIFDPESAVSDRDSELEHEIGDWLEETDPATPKDVAAPVFNDGCKQNTPQLRELGAILSQDSEREYEGERRAHPMTSDNLRRHNALCPLAVLNPSMSTASPYLFRSRFSSRSLGGTTGSYGLTTTSSALNKLSIGTADAPLPVILSPELTPETRPTPQLPPLDPLAPYAVATMPIPTQVSPLRPVPPPQFA